MLRQVPLPAGRRLTVELTVSSQPRHHRHMTVAAAAAVVAVPAHHRSVERYWVAPHSGLAENSVNRPASYVAIPAVISHITELLNIGHYTPEPSRRKNSRHQLRKDRCMLTISLARLRSGYGAGDQQVTRSTPGRPAIHAATRSKTFTLL